VEDFEPGAQDSGTTNDIATMIVLNVPFLESKKHGIRFCIATGPCSLGTGQCINGTKPIMHAEACGLPDSFLGTWPWMLRNIYVQGRAEVFATDIKDVRQHKILYAHLSLNGVVVSPVVHSTGMTSVTDINTAVHSAADRMQRNKLGPARECSTASWVHSPFSSCHQYRK
jgi:hypothetical protein